MTALGRTFDGLGGVSAGTGPRLLVDYPEPVRSDILDFLFLPKFGAAIQVLKIEIGGTGPSTQGTEDTHEPQNNTFNPDAGFEFWVATEAKRRNPNISIYGLAWTFPGWVMRAEDFGAAAVKYLVDWVAVARSSQHLEVDLLGFHNESPWEKKWLIDLRRQLDARGFQHVQLVGADCGPGPGYQTPDILERIKNDAALDEALFAVGFHYPVSIMPAQRNRTFYDGLLKLKQKIWASEEYSTYSDSKGGRCLAKLFNRNYVDAQFTSSLVWDMMWSSFDGTACSGQGILWAAEPWTGLYGVVDTVWAMAHTTQFTERGWKFLTLPGGAGYLPSMAGSYVTLVSDASPSAHVTLVIETMDNHDSSCAYGNDGWKNVTGAAGPVEFCVSQTACAAHRSWFSFRSVMNIGGARFEELDPVTPLLSNGTCCFTLPLLANSVYTVSTTSGATKGDRPGNRITAVEGLSGGCSAFSTPIASPFPLPYATKFDEPDRFHDFPKYLSDAEGVFRVRQVDGVHALQQQTLDLSSDGPRYGQLPMAMLGSKNWTDYSVSAVASAGSELGKLGGVIAVYARVGHGWDFAPAGGYGLFVTTNSTWELRTTLPNQTTVVLAAGTLAGSRASASHSLRLQVSGEHISGFVDGQMVASVTDRSYANGLAGLGCGLHKAEFTYFSVRPIESDQADEPVLVV